MCLFFFSAVFPAPKILKYLMNEWTRQMVKHESAYEMGGRKLRKGILNMKSALQKIINAHRYTFHQQPGEFSQKWNFYRNPGILIMWLQMGLWHVQSKTIGLSLSKVPSHLNKDCRHSFKYVQCFKKHTKGEKIYRTKIVQNSSLK